MRIIVGVTGASGVEMSYYLVKALKNIEGCQVHLILTEGAKKTWKLESDIPLIDLVLLADVVHEDENLAAVISSGSYVTEDVYKRQPYAGGGRTLRFPAFCADGYRHGGHGAVL